MYLSNKNVPKEVAARQVLPRQPTNSVTGWKINPLNGTSLITSSSSHFSFYNLNLISKNLFLSINFLSGNITTVKT